MMQTMADFMAWASPAIVNTMGGECAPIQDGWLSSNAFGTITVPYDQPDTYYLLVTTPPEPPRDSVLRVQHDDIAIASSTDLRTGAPCEFTADGAIDIVQLNDWSDIERYGARIFKISTMPIG